MRRWASRPVHSLTGLDALNDKLRLGEILTAAELIAIGDFLNHCRLLKNYLKRALTIDPVAPSLGMSVEPLDEIRKEIERCFRGERLDDRASPELFQIRAGIERLAAKIKDRLASMMRAHPEWFQESFYSVRGRRYVLPVKRECSKLVRGHTLDISGSGQTVFIEPEAAAALRDEMEALTIDEANEEIRILSELSNMAAAAREALLINRESMEKLDYVFACGILASRMRCGELAIARGFELKLENARHPLLGEGAVPMSLTLGGRVRALVITGPNTGGKTVSIKTAGLTAAMALSGLQVPAERAVVPLFSGIYCDIGDGQSVSQNLSTFSSHMRRVVRILAAAGPRALVLLDEVGGGTDPQEGMGLAVAILTELGADEVPAHGHLPLRRTQAVRGPDAGISERQNDLRPGDALAHLPSGAGRGGRKLRAGHREGLGHAGKAAHRRPRRRVPVRQGAERAHPELAHAGTH